MSDNDVKELLLRDPLSAVSRKERRNLLVISAIGLIMVNGGLLPSKISALGIEFSQADKYSLLKILSWIIAYFLFAFILYAISDLLTWRLNIFLAIGKLQNGKINDGNICNTKLKLAETGIRFEREIQTKLPSFLKSFYIYSVSIIRAIFEFFLPIVIGTYTIIILRIAN